MRKAKRIRKILLITIVLSIFILGNINTTRAADIAIEEYPTGTSVLCDDTWRTIILVNNTDPGSAFIRSDGFYRRYNSNWPDQYNSHLVGYVAGGSSDRVNISDSGEWRLLLDGEVFREGTIALIGMGDGGRFAELRVPAISFDKMFNRFELQVKITGSVMYSGGSTTSAAYANFNVFNIIDGNRRGYSGVTLQRTDVATAKLLNTAISAEEAKQAAQEAREKAQEALDKAEAARSASVQAGSKVDALDTKVTNLNSNLISMQTNLNQKLLDLANTISNIDFDTSDLETSINTQLQNQQQNINNLTKQVNNSVAIHNVVSLNRLQSKIKNEIRLMVDYDSRYTLSVENLPPGALITENSNGLIVINTQNTGGKMSEFIRIKARYEEDGEQFETSRTLPRSQFWFEPVNIE